MPRRNWAPMNTRPAPTLSARAPRGTAPARPASPPAVRPMPTWALLNPTVRVKYSAALVRNSPVPTASTAAITASPRPVAVSGMRAAPMARRAPWTTPARLLPDVSPGTSRRDPGGPSGAGGSGGRRRSARMPGRWLGRGGGLGVGDATRPGPGLDRDRPGAAQRRTAGILRRGPGRHDVAGSLPGAGRRVQRLAGLGGKVDLDHARGGRRPVDAPHGGDDPGLAGKDRQEAHRRPADRGRRAARLAPQQAGEVRLHEAEAPG